MISKAHKDKIEDLWAMGCERRNKGLVIQAYELYQAISEESPDKPFEELLQSIRYDIFIDYAADIKKPIEETFEELMLDVKENIMVGHAIANHKSDFSKVYAEIEHNIKVIVLNPLKKQRAAIKAIEAFAFKEIPYSGFGFVR